MRTDPDDSNGERRGPAAADAQPASAAERLRALIGQHTSEMNRLLDETVAREELLSKLSLELAGVAAWTFRSVEALISQVRAAQHVARHTMSPPGPTESQPKQPLSIDASAPVRPASSEQRQLTESHTRRPLDTVEWIHAELADTRAALELNRQTLERERTERLRLENVVREGYAQLKRRVVESINALVPSRATVAVVSKGDEDLVRLDARRGWHFPQTDTATYAGHHPANSAAAIAHLEQLRSKGAQYLVFPATSRWWLDYYGDFADYLTRTYRRVLDRDDVGVVFDVRRARVFPRDWKTDVRSLLEEFQARYRRAPVVLDCHTGLDLASVVPQHSVFVPPDANAALPYLERTVDVVVHAAGSSFAAEARRVAGTLLVTTGAANGARRSRHMPRIRAEWLVDEPRDAAPTVSIIIPCHNGRRLTNACLSAVEAALPASFTGEIIVIDDASTDGTRAMLARWARRSRRVKILRNARNLGFLRSCNRAARAARGDVLVLLNNDTQPCPGWLTALLRTFEDHPAVGAVGGKLVFPDGRLQEAGGLIFRDGSAMHFGRGDGNPDHPLFNFVRPVDYCSAALLATPRRVFLEVGGFDSFYLPAYYEDTDYCFKLWDKGLRVYYQPAASVVHHEGVSCGTDLTRGVKRYQIVNQEKFRQRWKSALERQPDRPLEENLDVWQRLAIRPV